MCELGVGEGCPQFAKGCPVGSSVSMVKHREIDLCAVVYLSGEILCQVLVDDAVRGREEREDRRDEVALLVVELLLPVLHVVAEIDLLSRPERGLSFFVHSPVWEGVASTA